MPVHHRITPDLLQTNETSASRMKLMDADSGNRPSSGSACASYGILYDNNRQNKCHRQSFQPDNPCHLLQINPRIPLRAKRSRFWRHASSRISICLTHRACMQTAHLPHPCKYTGSAIPLRIGRLPGSSLASATIHNSIIVRLDKCQNLSLRKSANSKINTPAEMLISNNHIHPIFTIQVLKAFLSAA